MPRPTTQKAARAIPSLTPAQAIAPGGILSYAFPGNTWGRWLAVLRAAWGEHLTPEEERLFREVAGDRAPPQTQVREVWAVLGRRAGKDSVASAIVAAVALQDHRPHLRPGERATCLCIASTVDQAKIISRYVRAYFAEGGPLRQFVVKETDEALELSTGAEIIVSAGNFRVVRGRALACCVLDEVAFYANQEAANSDTELLTAIEPALETLPGAILVAISSPYRRNGIMFERWAKYFGKNDPDVLILHAESRQFNPLVRQETIDKAMEADPEKAGAEWLARWRDDISGFIDRDLVTAAVEPDVTSRSPLQEIEYALFVDASGGRGSSFTAAIAHAEGDTVILDALYERRPPFSPAEVVPEVAELARRYQVSTATGDRYAAEWVVEAFGAAGIAYRTSDRDKSALYLDALPLFTSGRVRLLDNKRLAHQFTTLERRTARLGRDKVGPASGASDDLANATAGALVHAASDSKPRLFRSSQLTQDGAGVPVPRLCEKVDAVLWIDADGMAAVTYWAYYSLSATPLVLLDFALAPVNAGTVRDIYVRANEFARNCNMQYGGRMYVPPALVDSFAEYGADSVPRSWLVDVNTLRLAAGTQVSSGIVKLSDPAATKAAGTAFAGSLEGWMRQPDALAMSFMLGVVLALGLPDPR